MKLHLLTVYDVENVTAEFDFDAVNVHYPEQAVTFLEYALFGNDVLFSGKINLTVSLGEDDYTIDRDFAGRTVVTKNGEVLAESKANEALAKIAGLKKGPFHENTLPIDSEEFLSDASGFVKKYLAKLGIDGEELEKRGDFYYKDHSLFVSKVEAYDELVDDTLEEKVAQKKAEMEDLQEQLGKVSRVKKAAEEKRLILALKSSLSERKENLLAKSAEIEEKREKVAADDATVEKIARIEKSQQLDEKVLILKADLNALKEEIVAIEEEKTALLPVLSDKEEKLNERKAQFEEIISKNLDGQEATATVTSRAEDKEGDPISDLKTYHVDYLYKKNVREGAVFESNVDEAKIRVADLGAKIDQNMALLERIDAEINLNGGVSPASEFVKKSDNKQLLGAYESKITARNLEIDIQHEEDKIRSLQKRKKMHLEDVVALKKAKIAQTEYVRRLEKGGYPDDVIMEGKAKLNKIDLRLAHLEERTKLYSTSIDELTSSVFSKKRVLASILTRNGATTVADLERNFQALPPLEGEGNNREYIAFLQEQAIALVEFIEKDYATLDKEQARLNEMMEYYDAAIYHGLGGKDAIDAAVEMVELEKQEDEMVAALGGGNYAGITQEVFAVVMEELKAVSEKKTVAEKEYREVADHVVALDNAIAERNFVIEEIKKQLTEEDLNEEDIADATEQTENVEELKGTLLSAEEKDALVQEIRAYDEDVDALTIQISALDGYKEEEFNQSDYSELAAATEKAEAEYDKIATRLVVSNAARELAIEKAYMCEILTEKMDKVKKIADGEIFDIVMPIISEVLEGAGAKYTARPDGLEISFYDTGAKKKKVAYGDVDESVMTTLIDCAINEIMSLVSGEETVRFSAIDGKEELLKPIAQKYGVVIL